MREENDWRLQGQHRYLTGVELLWQTYTEYRTGWEHDHCAFCWAEFSEKLPDSLRSGFATSDRYHWVCETCFEDFHDLFQWKVSKPGAQ